jgi:hypothetical protein
MRSPLPAFVIAPRRAVLVVHVVAALAACAPASNEGEGEDVAEGEGEGDACPVDGEGVLTLGEACTFNADCARDLRCECVDGACACQAGTRGCGANGVDECVDGNDCVTALCVEGSGSAFFCSGPCVTNDDCGAALPVCADIAFVGRICIRESP